MEKTMQLHWGLTSKRLTLYWRRPASVAGARTISSREHARIEGKWSGGGKHHRVGPSRSKSENVAGSEEG
jgi:hypothetical protein